MKFYKLRDSNEILLMACEGKIISRSINRLTGEFTEIRTLNTLRREDGSLTAQPDENIIFIGEIEEE